MPLLILLSCARFDSVRSRTEELKEDDARPMTDSLSLTESGCCSTRRLAASDRRGNSGGTARSSRLRFRDIRDQAFKAKELSSWRRKHTGSKTSEFMKRNDVDSWIHGFMLIRSSRESFACQALVAVVTLGIEDAGIQVGVN